MTIEWKDDLVKEKSLWQVYRASLRLPKSTFNQWAGLVSIVAIALISINWAVNARAEQAYKATLLISDIGFDLSVQILGFLIGGFAIFATVTDHRLMIKLAETPMSEGGVSVFKNIFFNFLSVFYIFLITLATSIIIKLIGGIEFFSFEYFIQKRHLLLAGLIINCAAFFFNFNDGSTFCN